jgi:uncharacterized protein (TIGR02996 family)
MSDRDALLAAIRQVPDDDAPRLVYADWLDEHGDADRAEFIRLQVEIDPYRRPDSDLDRWRRAVIDRHLDRPVPADFPPEIHRYARLARREADLLKARRWEWLAPLARVDEDYNSHLVVGFRRGFAERVGLTTSAFLECGDLVRSACPLLRQLALYGPREKVPDLAGHAALNGVPELELAGWITAHDARLLAPSAAYRGVESLTVWVGSRHDSDVVRELANRLWDGGPGRPPAGLRSAAHLPNLREVVLVQLYGGRIAADATDGLDRRANDLAGDFNRLLGRPVARVERPYARRFPVNARVGHGLFAGNVRGRPAVLRTGRFPYLLQFDPAGGQTHEDPLDLDDHLPESELLTVLRREYGFELGPAFVREFDSEEANLTVHLWGNYGDFIEDPDSQLDGDGHEGVCAELAQYWIMDGHFSIVCGDEYVAGPDGVIHSH